MAKINDMWLKVLIGVIITLTIACFGALEKKKLDKSVFNIHKEQKVIDQQRIERQLTRIEDKIDAMIK